MSHTFDALFDGEVLRPDDKLELEPNTRVRVTIEAAAPAPPPSSLIRTLKSLKISGPPDWSENLEEYLYGDLTAGR